MIKMNFKSLLLAAITSLLLISFSACKKENTNGLTGTGPVTFHFDNRYGPDDLVLGNTYTTANGEQLTPTTFNYFVSNFILVKGDGSEFVVPKDDCYHLVREGVDSTYELEIENVPAGEYTGLKFTIGVDSAKSTAPVSERTGDLDIAGAASDMYWTWNSGYIFYKLEGTSPQAPYDSMMGAALMFYHMGGYGGYSSSTVNNLRKVSLTATEGALVGVGHHPEFHIFADVDAVFANPAVIKIADHPGDMSTPFSTTISANYADMFSINHVHNE